MSLFFKKKVKKSIKYPCRKCVYFSACGDGARTEKCDIRKTRKELREENNI